MLNRLAVGRTLKAEDGREFSAASAVVEEFNEKIGPEHGEKMFLLRSLFQCDLPESACPETSKYKGLEIDNIQVDLTSLNILNDDVFTTRNSRCRCCSENPELRGDSIWKRYRRWIRLDPVGTRQGVHLHLDELIVVGCHPENSLTSLNLCGVTQGMNFGSSDKELEEIDKKKEIEDLEDMTKRLSARKSIKTYKGWPTLKDFQQLKLCLKNLMERLSLDVNPSIARNITVVNMEALAIRGKRSSPGTGQFDGYP
ncbi:hypothetical protein IW262DRAFT_1302543 [Armillaria fumosa]|nr:hypothetical protein IW262DRAFT_1302543 [Armillaria fumosa]